MDNNKTSLNKLRLFLENFFVYGFGSVIEKLVPLIMLPIITRLMPDTSYFGISDLSGTVISFGCAFAVIGMYDAMYRMFFEKDEFIFKKTVCSTTLVFTLTTSVIVTIFMMIVRDYIASFFFSDIKYSYLVYISALATLVSATNTIVSAPTRMQNKRRIYLIANTVGPIIAYAISILLLLKEYYVIALPLSMLISSASIEVTFLILNRKWFDFRMFDKKLLKQMLMIAVPLFPNFLIYWIFNSCDKIMISNLIDVEAVGIYSIGAKLGNVSQLIYTAFAGGWQYFAFSTMKEKNQVESNSRIFEYLGIISFIISVFVFSLAKVLFRVLFIGDYIDGYIVSPYLFMAPLVQMLFQIIANQFLIIKKTWPSMFILMVGAVLNIILNFSLIPLLGIEGAAIATLLGYVCSDILCCIVLLHMKLMVISTRFLISCSIMTAFILFWRLLLYSNVVFSLFAAFITSVIMCYLYRMELSFIIKKTK